MTLETENTAADIDPFEAAFKELSDLENKGAESAAVNTQDTDASSLTTEDNKSVEDDADNQNTEQVSNEETSTTASEESTEPEQKVDPTESLLSKFSELIDRTQPAKQEPPTQTQQVQQEQETEIYSKDEQDYLKTYETEWPDVIKGEALRRKQEYHHLLGYVFKEVADQIRPMMETLQTLAERTHYSDLTSQVSDYSDIRDKVIDWAEKQPAYLQVAYKHVIEKGTVDEVKDLVERYRRDVGVQSPAPQPTTKQVKSTELSPATKQAAAALAPVQSKRSVVKSNEIDFTDFDSAFAAYAKED